jgi:hypothetical protein
VLWEEQHADHPVAGVGCREADLFPDPVFVILVLPLHARVEIVSAMSRRQADASAGFPYCYFLGITGISLLW